MTEEEKDAAEANKGKKPADAGKPKPGAKGAANKEEEPTEEEVAAMKAEVKQRED